jgi:hypothetical protein
MNKQVTVHQLIPSQMKETSSESLHAGAIGALAAFKVLSLCLFGTIHRC